MPFWHHADRWGIAVLRPSAPPPPSGRPSSHRWARRPAWRRTQPVGAPSMPVKSTGRNVDDVEVLRAPQHPCWRALVSQRQVRRGPGLSRFAAVHGVHCGW
jgi:hypothetical protein